MRAEDNSMLKSTSRQALLSSRLSEEEARFFEANKARVDSTAVVKGQLPVVYNPFGSRLQIGAHTVLNSDNSTSFVPIISPVKFALGDGAEVIVGEHCDLNGCAIAAYRYVEIGNYVQIGPSTWISDTDLHALDPSVRRNQLDGVPYDRSQVGTAAVIIEDDVWIGSSVLILKGIRVGRGAVIGAGSVVVDDVPPFSIVVGNPARVVGNTTQRI